MLYYYHRAAVRRGYEEAIAISTSLNSCNRYPRFEGDTQPGLTSFASIPAPITCCQRLLPILLRRAAISRLWDTRRTRARCRPLPPSDVFLFSPILSVRAIGRERKKEGERQSSKDQFSNREIIRRFFPKITRVTVGRVENSSTRWFFSFSFLARKEVDWIRSIGTESWNDTSFASQLKYLKFLPTRMATRQLEH